MTRISNRHWMNGARNSSHQNRITKLNYETFWRIFVYFCFTQSREVAWKSCHGHAFPEQQTKTLWWISKYIQCKCRLSPFLNNVLHVCVTVCMCVGECTSWRGTSFNHLHGGWHILRARCFSKGLPWRDFRVSFKSFLILPRLLW